MTARRGMARLWSPWRMAYISKAGPAARPRARTAAAPRSRGPSAADDAGCLFCRVGAGDDDRLDLVLARLGCAMLMLNRFPYNPAHLMVAVTRHAAAIGDLTDAERRDLLELTALAERALEAEYHPHGLNYGANSGRVAGAGFPGHLHLHLVPRWDGDTNFMPVIGETRVLPESLGQTWTRLRRAIRGLKRSAPRTGGRRGARR